MISPSLHPHTLIITLTITTMESGTPNQPSSEPASPLPATDLTEGSILSIFHLTRDTRADDVWTLANDNTFDVPEHLGRRTHSDKNRRITSTQRAPSPRTTMFSTARNTATHASCAHG